MIARWRDRAINGSKTRSTCCRQRSTSGSRLRAVRGGRTWSRSPSTGPVMQLIVTTTRSSQTGRNFAGTGRARAAIGQTRGQVVVIDALVEEMPVGENVEFEDADVRATDFDPGHG